jgi:Ni2+-binding GTPase involved in maturation of urease and hydrogenase
MIKFSGINQLIVFIGFTLLIGLLSINLATPIGKGKAFLIEKLNYDYKKLYMAVLKDL